MRTFKIPFKTEFSDKVFGGYLSFKQLGWLVAPVLLFLALCMDHSLTIKVVKGQKMINWSTIAVMVIIDVILLGICSIFAFVKINGIDLDRYLLKIIMFKLKDKVIKFYK